MRRGENVSKYNNGVLLPGIHIYSRAEVALIDDALFLFEAKSLQNASVVIRVAQILVDQKVDAVILVSFILAPLLWEQSISIISIRDKFGWKVSKLLTKFILPPAFRRETDAYFVEGMEEQRTLSRLFSRDISRATMSLAFILLDLENIIANNASTHIKKVGDVLASVEPVVSELNLFILRRKIEGAAFKIVRPEEYADLKRQVTFLSAGDEQCLDSTKTATHSLLKEHSIKGRVQGRIKSLYSIYSKIKYSGKNLDSIEDRIGLRIIVPTVQECYRVLEVLHAYFHPIPGSFDDYIELPKENGYQSLHTCVYPVRDVGRKLVEFQIRTESMHHDSEFGNAAHWQYKWQKRIRTLGRKGTKKSRDKEQDDPCYGVQNVGTSRQLSHQ